MTDDQFLVIATLLAEIRDLLATGIEAADADAKCAHPEEKRINLSTFNDQNHWVCAECKFDNKAPEAMN